MISSSSSSVMLSLRLGLAAYCCSMRQVNSPGQGLSGEVTIVNLSHPAGTWQSADKQGQDCMACPPMDQSSTVTTASIVSLNQ